MAFNAVMLSADSRTPIPLPEENFLYHCGGVKFNLKKGDGYPGNSIAYQASTAGTAFVSNQRIVFISKTATASNNTPDSLSNTDIKSFTAPLAQLSNISFAQPVFGANRFEAGTANGRLVLTFKDGGGFDFADVCKKMKARISETGSTPRYEEPLPLYDDAQPPRNQQPPSPAQGGGEPSRPPAYSDAPPGYDDYTAPPPPPK